MDYSLLLANDNDSLYQCKLLNIERRALSL